MAAKAQRKPTALRRSFLTRRGYRCRTHDSVCTRRRAPVAPGARHQRIAGPSVTARRPTGSAGEDSGYPCLACGHSTGAAQPRSGAGAACGYGTAAVQPTRGQARRAATALPLPDADPRQARSPHRPRAGPTAWCPGDARPKMCRPRRDLPGPPARPGAGKTRAGRSRDRGKHPHRATPGRGGRRARSRAQPPAACSPAQPALSLLSNTVASTFPTPEAVASTFPTRKALGGPAATPR